MGSSISLFNTTSDTYEVRVIPTTWSFSRPIDLVNDFVSGIVGFNASVVGASVIEMHGVTPRSLAPVVDHANNVSGSNANQVNARGWASSVAILLSDALINQQHYVRITPRQSHKVDEPTLSLIRRAPCYRIRVDPRNPEQVSIDLLVMHPIFSGPTAGSTNVYHMQDWINNNGFTELQTLRLDVASQQALAASRASATELEPTAWLQEYQEAGLRAKQEALKQAGMASDAGIVAS
ncbi:hypothetical protein L7F22_031987 [Adiantum nelumboides]|nr:hypothetical protein [Adiantum nelumboides]